MGKALEKTLANRLKTVDSKQLVDPFRYRNERAGWRCEFWGKIVRPAIWANYFIQDKELTEIFEKTVDDILSTQTPEGRISSFPDDVQFTSCDIWGRKYVLLGLIAYYELVKPDPRIPGACAAVLRDLEKTLAERGLKWEETGTHMGLATCSILGAVVGTWRITKDPHWKQLAEEMIGTVLRETGITATAGIGIPVYIFAFVSVLIAMSLKTSRSPISSGGSNE